MSTVAEIEAAIEKLGDNEREQLRERFGALEGRALQGLAIVPKTGAELARLWPTRFHLRPDEADALATEMDDGRKPPPQSPAWE